MVYKWFMEDLTVEKVEKLTGKKVKGLTKGALRTGEVIPVGNPDGTTSQIPVTKEGIEIEFEQEPTAEELKRVDMDLTGCRREGGKTIAEEIDELKTRVDKLDTSSGEV